jgi:hypothetical protein
MFFFNNWLCLVLFCLYRCESETGDERDIVKLVQHCSNRSISQRAISKQEAMCELA